MTHLPSYECFHCSQRISFLIFITKEMRASNYEKPQACSVCPNYYYSYSEFSLKLAIFINHCLKQLRGMLASTKDDKSMLNEIINVVSSRDPCGNNLSKFRGIARLIYDFDSWYGNGKVFYSRLISKFAKKIYKLYSKISESWNRRFVFLCFFFTLFQTTRATLSIVTCM